MPLFQISPDRPLAPIEQANFSLERELQRLIEKSLDPVFRCRFVASEFPTGIQHGGRIDTLALSEDDNPVIIEYKKIASSELVTQSLYYLAWIHDHKGDFELAVQKALGPEATVEWDDVRVICLAPSYKKFDVHAVQVMGASIELWTYRLFGNKTLFLDELQTKDLGVRHTETSSAVKNPVMVAAGKKAAETRQTATYTFEEHLEGKPEWIKELAVAVQEHMLLMDEAIEERPKKLYVAYRTTQNIVCMEVQHKKVTLFLKLDPQKFPEQKGFLRDVSKVGHFGTGDIEITLQSLEDFERAKPLIQQSYENVGG
jgi:predicted transport protein